MIQSVWRQLRITLEMIKIEHTVFALPFAFIGAILAERGIPALRTCVWILLAMIWARSAAMAFNRLVDARIDADNPRTRDRALPRGLVSRGYVAGFVVICSGMFLLSAWMLNRLSFVLAFPALALVLAYSFSKRFTSFSHILLGLALSIAPVGGWIAVTGRLDPEVLLLCLVVVTWVAGFDIVYSCQDVGFDSKFGLFSIPARWGVPRALVISFGLHIVTIASLFLMYFAFRLSWFSLAGIAALAGILVYEHVVIRPGDLTRVNMAFFTLNGIFSISLFIFILGDVLLFPNS
jgi:4-hydroxybenzoate polyprenyltransferase